jgi:hypothetical protein
MGNLHKIPRMPLQITIHDLIPDYQEPVISNPEDPAPAIVTDVDLDTLLTMPIDQVIINYYIKEK